MAGVATQDAPTTTTRCGYLMVSLSVVNGASIDYVLGLASLTGVTIHGICVYSYRAAEVGDIRDIGPLFLEKTTRSATVLAFHPEPHVHGRRTAH